MARAISFAITHLQPKRSDFSVTVALTNAVCSPSSHRPQMVVRNGTYQTHHIFHGPLLQKHLIIGTNHNATIAEPECLKEHAV